MEEELEVQGIRSSPKSESLNKINMTFFERPKYQSVLPKKAISSCSHIIRSRQKADLNLGLHRDYLKEAKFKEQSSQILQQACFRVSYIESWTVKKAERWRIDAFELWCWRRLLRVPWTARRSNQSIKRRSVLGVHWKDWCWSWNSNTLAIDAKSWLTKKDPDTGKDWR